jgi:hypothetical protein
MARRNRQVLAGRQRQSRTTPMSSSNPRGPAVGASARAGQEILCISPSLASGKHTPARVNLGAWGMLLLCGRRHHSCTTDAREGEEGALFWPISVAKAPPPLSFLPRSLHEPPKVAASSFYTMTSSMPRLTVWGDTCTHTQADELRPLLPIGEARMTARV